jgi:hypothetical protein
MSAPIRGIRVEENRYLFAHAAGRYFRQKATRGNSVVRHKSPDGTVWTEIPARKVRDARLEALPEQGWAGLARAVLGKRDSLTAAKAGNITSITHKRGQHTQGPSLSIRG